MKLSFLLFTKYLAIALLITAFSGCNSPFASPNASRAFSPAIQKDLLHLHQLQSYRAGKNRMLVKMLDTPNVNTMWAGIGMRILNLNGTNYE